MKIPNLEEILPADVRQKAYKAYVYACAIVAIGIPVLAVFGLAQNTIVTAISVLLAGVGTAIGAVAKDNVPTTPLEDLDS